MEFSGAGSGYEIGSGNGGFLGKFGINTSWCECTDNVSKENYLCAIFAVLITLYVNSRLNGFHELMVFTIIIFMNTREKKLERKTVSKSAPSRVA